MQRLRFLLILAVFVIAFSLQTFTAQATRTVGAYSRIYEGIEVATGYADTPRLQRVFVFRVSLRNPNVSLFASHDNGGAAYEVTLQRPDDFMYEHGLKMAANATFWNAAQSPNADVYGYVVSNGIQVSGPDGTFSGQLYFTSEKIATLRNSTQTGTGVNQGVGGGGQVLTNGVITTGDNSINPYTFYGISQDGKYMIIVAVDGRQPGWSEGCTMPEMAQWLIDFGAYNGMQMDGGGSTGVSRADIGVWNRPCYGYMRSVAVSLGANSTGGNGQGPSVCSMDSTRTDVFTRGAMQHMHQKYWTTSSGWSSWIDVGGNTIYSPAISTWGTNRLDLFNVDPNGCIWWAYYNGTAWSGWNKFNGTYTPCPPAACSWGANRIDCFNVSGYDHKIYWANYNGSSWSGWTCFPTYTNTNLAPAVCSWGANRLDLFNVSPGGTMYWSYYNGSTWSAWASLGGNTPYPVSACSWGANRIDMFNVAPTGDVYWCNYNGSTWSGYTNLGGGSVGAPAATTRGNGLIDVFIRSSNDHLLERSYNNGTWSPWADWGPYYD